MTDTRDQREPAGRPLVGSGGARAADPGSRREVPRPSLPAERERRWPESARLRLALGFALVAVLAFAWAAVGRAPQPERSASPRPAPRHPSANRTTTSGSTAAPNAAAAIAVPRWVPAAIAATCRARGTAPAPVVDCTPGRGVTSLEYRGFASNAVLRHAYAAVSPRVGGRGAPACARGAPEERAWSVAAAPSAPVGRYRCRVAGGRAQLVWTRERVGGKGAAVLAIATRVDGDLRSLYEWWTTVPGPAVPAVDEG